MLQNFSPNPSTVSYYCYWDIRSIQDFIIMIIILSLAFAIVLQVVIAYRRSKKFLQPDSLFHIYYFLGAWYVSYTVEYVFGLVIFKKEFEGKGSDADAQTIVKYSVIFEFLDFFPAFLLVSCLNYVSYHLLKRIHNICDLNGHHPTQMQLRFYRWLKKYQFIRVLFVTPTIALLFVMNQPANTISVYSTVEVCLYLFDSLMCNLVLFVAVQTLRKKRELLRLSDENQEKKLNRQSILLQLAGICRFVMGLTFILISSFKDQQDDGEICPDRSQYRTWMYILVGQILMHFVPVLVVLSIFRISRGDIENMSRNGDSFLSGKNLQYDED